MAEEHGSPLRINPATEGAPLRGLLALLMRSVASSKDPLNYCALVKEDAGRYLALAVSWAAKSQPDLAYHTCKGILGAFVEDGTEESPKCYNHERQGTR